MAVYVTNQGDRVALQIFLLLGYLLFLSMTAHAVLGIARTATLRLPVRSGKYGVPNLFEGDYSPKIHQLDGRGRKAFKIAVLVFVAILIVATWLVFVYGAYTASAPWFGWGLVDDAVVVAGNVAIFIGVCALAAWQGVRHAQRYSLHSLPHPFERLAPYVEDSLARGVNCTPMGEGITRLDDMTLTSVKLPKKGSVVVFRKDGELMHFKLDDSDRESAIATVSPESQHQNNQLVLIDWFLRDNGF